LRTQREPPPSFDSLTSDRANATVISKGQCPKCDTDHGFVTYADGHGYCFACQHKVARVAGDGNATADQSRGHTGSDRGLNLLRPGDQTQPYRDLSNRGLTAATLRRYGYFLAGYSGQTVQVAPYFDQDGNEAAQKLRFQDKSFTILPQGASLGRCRLFGHHVYGDKFDRKIIITEGELDAMSVAQAVDFKFPSVSVNTGAAGAAKCLKANYLWLDRFEEIILWFDDDEPGKKATEECAKLFPVGKVRVVSTRGL
jgi:twinkle protein